MHFGIYYRLKKLGMIQHKCCICGQYSECTIERWRGWFNILFIPVFIAEKGYLFTWSACNHSMGLDDLIAVKQYTEEQVDTGILSVPVCEKLKPMTIERPMPINAKNILLLSPFILIIGLGLLYICLVMLGLR